MSREEPTEIAAWRSMLRAHAAALRAIEASLAGAGEIPLTWYDVLLELSVEPGRRLRMQALSDRVLLSRTRVSRLVEEIARAGLVRRESDPDDGRGAFAVLTSEGQERLRRAAPVYIRGIRDHFSRYLDQAELAAVHVALAKVADAHAVSRSTGGSGSASAGSP